MGVYIGTTKLKSVYIGTSKVGKIYIGTSLVYQSTIFVNKPTNLTPSGTWTGSTITNGYTTPTGVTMTGSNSGTSAGTYTATYTPDSGYAWTDGTTTSVSVVLTINRASVGAKPTTSVTKSYTGSAQTNGYTCPTYVTKTGTSSATNGGIYTATYTPDSNHKWSDGTTSTVTVTLTIQYVWTVWSVDTTYAESVTSGRVYASDYQEFSISGGYLYRTGSTGSYSFNASTGKYTIGGSNGAWYTLGSSLTKVSSYSSTVLGKSSAKTNAFDTVITYASGLVNAYANTSKVRLSNTDDMNNFPYYKRTAVVSGYSKGTTQYANVTSTTDSSAYPSNGKSGNRWYVKTW